MNEERSSFCGNFLLVISLLLILPAALNSPTSTSKSNFKQRYFTTSDAAPIEAYQAEESSFSEQQENFDSAQGDQLRSLELEPEERKEEEDEFLLIERRRLERDRVREPADWLRARPMRRALNKVLFNGNDDDDDNDNDTDTDDEQNSRPIYGEGRLEWAPIVEEEKQEDEIEKEKTKSRSAGGGGGGEEEAEDEEQQLSQILLESRPARGRHSRQSSAEALEHAVGNLLAGAYENRAPIEEFYQELEERERAANQRQMKALLVSAQQQQQQLQLQSTSANKNENSLIQQAALMRKQQLKQRQEEEQEPQEANQNELLLSNVQDSESGETLVVARDDISSGGADDLIIQPADHSMKPTTGPIVGGPTKSTTTTTTTTSTATATANAAPTTQTTSSADSSRLPTNANQPAEGEPEASEPYASQIQGSPISVEQQIEGALSPAVAVNLGAEAEGGGGREKVVVDGGSVYLLGSDGARSQRLLLSANDGKDFPTLLQEQQPELIDRVLLVSSTSPNLYSLQANRLLNQQQRDPHEVPLISSFHVVEDIDQVTDSEPSLVEQESPSSGSGGYLEQQQQQQEQQQRLEKRAFIDEYTLSKTLAGHTLKRNVFPAGSAYLQTREVPLSKAEKFALLLGSAGGGVNSKKEQSQAVAAATMRMIESGRLSRQQLMQIAGRLRAELERELRLTPNSILGLYPLDEEQLLIKLDTNNLDAEQMFNMIQNYDYARGYIVASWPSASLAQQNPIPLLLVILNRLHQQQSDEWFRQQPTGSIDIPREYPPMPADYPPQESLPRPVASMVGVSDSNKLVWPNEMEQQQQQLLERENERLGVMNVARLTTAPSWSVASLLGAYLKTMYPNYNIARLSLVASNSEAGELLDNELSGGGGLDANTLSGGVEGEGKVLFWSKSGAAARNLFNNNSTGATSLSTDHLMHLLVVLVAIFSVFLAMKLVRRSKCSVAKTESGQDLIEEGMSGCSDQPEEEKPASSGAGFPPFLKRCLGGASDSYRSLWNGSKAGNWIPGSTTSSHQSIISSHSAQKQNEFANLAANLVDRTNSTGSENTLTNDPMPAATACSHSGSHQCKNLELLTERLVSLLSGRWPQQQQASGSERSGEKINIKKEIDEVCLSSGNELARAEEAAEYNGGAGFRSSRSYIKSLIDVLAKAKAQIPSSEAGFLRSNKLNSGSSGRRLLDEEEESDDDDDDDCNRQTTKEARNQQTAVKRQLSDPAAESGAAQQQETMGAGGVLSSQMDISAAHLILAYMEQHLEDKEQLRREWLELNSDSQHHHQHQQEGGKSSALAKQLMLQRLAKVALSDENRHKNRSLSVVPYDRYRVKLLTCPPLSPPPPPQASQATASKSSGRSRANNRNNNKNSDYINASFIYDDDPRRATHIIAQGPTGQTVGQFWQMVWEQGISVVVMLTRLNENSVRMCHCYWPAASSIQQQQQPATDNLAATNNRRTSTSTASPPPPPSGSHETNGAAAAAAGNGNGSAGQPATFPAQLPSNANGRRGSVTSVFNTARFNVNGGQPIIANGDLTNNILCFEVGSSTSSPSSSLDEESSPAKPTSDGATIDANNNAKAGRRQKSTSNSPTTTTTTTTTTGSSQKIEVHLVSEHVSSDDYLVRNMYMINRSTGETRTITQFHYLAWPEGGVPENVKSFLQFRRKVHKSYRNLKSPILVHCSDGAGRSGTYVLIDTILERIKNGAKEIDPRATLEHLRDQRVGLCANQSQFEFVLVALAEEIQIILNALPH